MRQYPYYEVPENPDTQSMTIDFGRRFPDWEALTVYTRRGEPRTHTYRQLSDDALAFMEGLCMRGWAGKHIAVCAENSYEWVVAFLGITGVGGLAVLCDPEQPDDILRAMLGDGDAERVFTSESMCELVTSLSGGRPVLALGGEEYEAILEDGRAALARGECAHLSRRPDPEDDCVIVHTSGTTSLPKPVLITQRALMRNAIDSVRNIFAKGKVFTGLPFCHAYGLSCSLISNLDRGIHLCVCGDLKVMLRDLRAFDPDSIMTVPLMVEIMYQKFWDAVRQEGKEDELHKLLRLNRRLRPFGIRLKKDLLDGLRQKAFGALRLIVCGGASLETQVQEEMRELGVLILQGYGISECSPLVSANRNRFYDMNTVGPLLPGVEVKTVDGELWVRGPSLMKEYYHSPEMTAEAMRDGWLCTGDLGFLDRRGFLHINGRVKNVIVFQNGKKVSPEVIEQYVLRLPLVKECVAHGVASGSSADDVKLAVSVYPDPAQTEGMSSYQILERLQSEVDRLNRTLPPYQQIQSVNIRDAAFDRTASHKIKR